MMARVLSFLKRYFSNYYTFHRSELAARAAPLDPSLGRFAEGAQTHLMFSVLVTQGVSEASGVRNFWHLSARILYTV